MRESYTGNGYNIRWTPNALKELAATIEYLENNFSDGEINKLALKIEEITKLIVQNPEIFPIFIHNVHRVVILKFNTMYYRIKDNEIEILSFFSNRQNPNKKRI